uniref:Predicted protein n=1 Tax=Physcomitrium patens TaxID=3218 RepID=A9TUZ6_PHYPA
MEVLIQTNFGKGGMRALIQDYLKAYETARDSSQHKTLMEEKRRGNFDDMREESSSKRRSQGDKAREAASQELPINDTSASLEEKTKETKVKSKSIAYKLLSDIEAATDLKKMLEEHILNVKVEFTLKETLEITKKEFHDVIIDNIKRKRQQMSKAGMSHAIDDMEASSHYTRKHWARITTEVFVKVGDIEEPIVALVDLGSEINLMSKDLYKRQKWPIDMEHGWVI